MIVYTLLTSFHNQSSSSIYLVFPGETVSEPNEDGTFKLTSTVSMSFERGDYDNKFRCIVQPPPGRGTKVTKDRRIFIRCKFAQVKMYKVLVNAN